jgi:hypothetical protein
MATLRGFHFGSINLSSSLMVGVKNTTLIADLGYRSLPLNIFAAMMIFFITETTCPGHMPGLFL